MDCLVALCQLRPVLGDLARNYAAHHDWLDRAEKEGADLVVFPELSTTGYFLRDLTQEVALPLTDARVAELVDRSRERSIVFGLVEETPDHRYYNSTVFAEDGTILHVHRKVFLPTYGIFEEGRYFAAGERFEVVASKLGRFGLLICEDAWHFEAGWLLFLQGADAILVPSAGPARGVDTDEAELSSQAAWNSLNAAQARFLQTWVLHCNRVGFEDGAMFWGGSASYTPFGYLAEQAHGDAEDLLLCRLQDDPLRRARAFTPLRRDTRPELVRLHLARLLQDPDALRPAEE